MTELRSWNDTGTTQAIVEFVETAARELPREERVAVFDNDGTLWSEKPMPIELGFILQRLAAMAEEDASLREKQPWKAAYEKDYAWLGGVIEKHYAGDDSDVKVRHRRNPAGLRRPDRGRVCVRCRQRSSVRGAAPNARPAAARLRVCPDGRAVALHRGTRIHLLHRVRR